VPSQESNQIREVQVRDEVWVHVKVLPTTNPAKAALPFRSSNNQVDSCKTNKEILKALHYIFRQE
jgi:hypothetical protein